MHLVGFIIRIYHDARSPECQGLSWAFRVYLVWFVVPEAKGEANVFPPFNCAIVLRRLAIKKTKKCNKPFVPVSQLVL